MCVDSVNCDGNCSKCHQERLDRKDAKIRRLTTLLREARKKLPDGYEGSLAWRIDRTLTEQDDSALCSHGLPLWACCIHCEKNILMDKSSEYCDHGYYKGYSCPVCSETEKSND